MPTKYPPKLSLAEAIKVIKAMYAESQSREVLIDRMPEILQTMITSSFFNNKISALQRFGFVEKREDTLHLTDLAMQIIEPVGNEEAEGKLQALQKIDVLSNLLQQYPDGKLPSAEVLQSLLYKKYQIHKSTLGKWQDFVTDSFSVISGITSGKQPFLTQGTSKLPSILGALSGFEFSIPLDSGEYIKLLVPKSASEKEILTTKAFLDALLKKKK